MKSVYISSTYDDLKDHRRAVADVLRSCGYNVEAMEKYAARDDRPKAACEADASSCDIYVGIFGWRYGHVPEEDNPEKRSITELEYGAALQAQKPRLVFLLSADVGPLSDPGGQRDMEPQIRELRARLAKERWVGSFRTPDDLAKNVLASVFQYESTKRVENMAAIEQIKTAQELGPSYLANIQAQIDKLGSVEFVALRLGPTPWWNTRLHLVAALASDFTEIQEFVLLDAEGRFLSITSPVELRRALAKALPKLEMTYLRCREMATGGYGGEVDRTVACYPTAVVELFGGQAEASVKQIMTPLNVRELGLKQLGDVLESSVNMRSILNADIVRRQVPYVVLMRDGNLEGVIDRMELASRIANAAMQG